MYIKNELKSEVGYVSISRVRVIEGKIYCNNNKKVNVTAIYRPHSINKENFIIDLQEYIGKNKHGDVHIIIGDINIDLFNMETSTEMYKNNYNEKGYLSLISTITRPSNYSGEKGTRIDHIFVKSLLATEDAQAFILKTNIIDHYTIFVLKKEISVANKEIKEHYIWYNKRKLVNKI